MTDSTNAKLRELRERVAGMRIGLVASAYQSKTSPSPCVYRQEVLSLIDAMIQEAGE